MIVRYGRNVLNCEEYGIVGTFDDICLKYGLPSVAELFADLENGVSLPSVLYCAPEVAALEEERIFSKCWSYACHESAVAKPGDYAVTNAGNTPIIITHGKDGQLRGFVNVCRHRLHSIAQENGSKSLLQCPYHGWAYELNGKLKSAPLSAREKNFDRSKIRLEPVAVEQWGQWVFVNPDPEAKSLAMFTEGIRDCTDELNADLREYEFKERYVYKVDCDWKIWTENALECYHCPLLHEHSLSEKYDTSPEEYKVTSDEWTVSHTGPLKWIPRGMDTGKLKGYRFYNIFPTSYVAGDDFVGYVGNVQPTGSQKCQGFLDLYVRPGTPEEISKDWLQMWDQVFKEDIRATNTQQIGYKSGRVRNGRLMLHTESPLQSFQRTILKLLSR